MAQQLNNLFDPQRRKALREAIRKGKDIFSGRAQTEPVMPGAESGGSTRMAVQMLLTSPPSFQVGKQTYKPNSFLMLAIQFNDIYHAESAIQHGANVNHLVAFLPVSPECDSQHPARINDPDVKTPLQYAVKLGRREIAEFLRKNGATE